jgi:hypothetical protein
MQEPVSGGQPVIQGVGGAIEGADHVDTATGRLPISPDNAVYKAELRQLFQECQVAGSRVGHPPEVPVTDEASFRQDSTLYATW